MTDDGPDKLVHRYLRRLDENVTLMREDLRDVKLRLTAVEVGLDTVRRDLVSLYEGDARLQVSVERQGARLERIEQRLGLRDRSAVGV
jgi:hypothetical protein